MSDRKRQTFAEWLEEFKRRNNLPDLELEPDPKPEPKPAPPPVQHWTDKENDS